MSLPFETGKPPLTTLSLKRDFKTGRTGRSARQIESTPSCQAASERFKTTSDGRQRRLYWEAPADGATAC
jgi:hypothetical protein